ncbi:MAG: type IX secretion system membrane protein PorP/SprF [Bacteroidales bacterium]|nr:type IX secretion system membrane protein PorP/SprF [Bacteroidales bacterium]
MKNFFINIAFIVFYIVGFSQYIPMLSDYYFNSVLLNPAYCGSREVLSATLFYRDQWKGLKGAPKTTSLSIHSPLKDLNMAIGMNMYNDKIGISEKSGVNINYVYRLRFNEGRKNLAFGIKTGIIHHFASISNLKLVDKNDNVFTVGNVKYTKIDIGGGLYFYSKYFYLGFSIPFFFNHQFTEDFSYKVEKFSILNKLLYSGGLINIGNDIQIHPSLCIYAGNYEKKVITKFSIIALKTLIFGISYRRNESTIFSIEYQINKQWCLGFSHDFVNLPFEKIIKSTNEIYLRYDLIKTYNVYSTRFF